jgi:hypothetical protein
MNRKKAKDSSGDKEEPQTFEDCFICKRSDGCKRHRGDFYDSYWERAYCDECLKLCPEHRIYGISGRPAGEEYGQVFVTIFNVMRDRWKETGGVRLTSLEELIGDRIRQSINKVTSAGEQARREIIDLLSIWRRDAPASGSHALWLFPHLEAGDTPSQDDIEEAGFSLAFAVPVELHGAFTKLTLNAHNDRAVAEMVGTSIAKDEQIWWPLFEAAFTMNPRAALTGLEAYVEAAGLLSRFEKQLRPPVFAQAAVTYYLGRRLSDAELIAQGKATMLYTNSPEPIRQGPLYRRAWFQYWSLPDVYHEIAADAFCDAFLRKLDELPVEALLSPALAIKYASQAGIWAGNKKLPKILPVVLIERDALEVKADPLPDEAAELEELLGTEGLEQAASVEAAEAKIDELEERGVLRSGSADEEIELVEAAFVTGLESLPNYDLALRHYGNNESLTELGEELGISKQAVQKRIQKFSEAAKKLNVDNNLE